MPQTVRRWFEATVNDEGCSRSLSDELVEAAATAAGPLFGSAEAIAALLDANADAG